MRIGIKLLTAAILLAGCGKRDAAEQNAAAPDAAQSGNTQAPATNASWHLQSSGGGVALALLAGQAVAAVRLSCPADAKQLIVNVPAFRPIGSEERLSFGSGGEAHALVADPRGDAQRGGVTGSGAVPANLAALISGPVSVSYGAQNSGPHPAPPQNLAAAFVGACGDQRGEPVSPKPASAPAPAGACLTQDSTAVPANRLRAIGTEPFWGARIEGRCVTYSHPDDQKGTRVWTRFSGRRPAAPGPARSAASRSSCAPGRTPDARTACRITATRLR